MKNTICKKEERIPVQEIDPMDGKGLLILDVLVDGENKPSKLDSFNKATLEPGALVGYHMHYGEGEYYFILSGKGVYNDNGTQIPVKEGDITYTPDGTGHGIENTGDEPLVFMTLVVKD